MNIAIVTSSFPLDPDDPASAAGLFVRDFALAVARRGHEVHVVTQDKGWGCKNPPENIAVTCYPWPGGSKALSQLKLYGIKDLHSAWSLIKNGKKTLIDLHRSISFDHVLAMWAVPSGMIARELCRRHGIRYSVWCLGSDIWTYGRIPVFRNVVRDVIRSAANCFADGLILGGDASRLSGRTFEFLPSSRKLPTDDVRPIDLDSDKPRFLFVGRYAHVKGVDTLLDAMADFRKREGKGSLFLLGGGPLENKLRQQIIANGLSNHVSLGGYADARTVVAYGKTCDAIVIPSRNESIPVVLSDAAQLGIPIIVSDVGDMGQIVRESSAGIVVPPDDPIALSRAVSEFSTGATDSYATGLAQLARKFDVDKAATHFIDCIQGCSPSSPLPASTHTGTSP